MSLYFELSNNTPMLFSNYSTHTLFDSAPLQYGLTMLQYYHKSIHV